MNSEKYYEGFEGEPEITFTLEKGKEREDFGVWDGYFNTIIRKIKPDASGWTGLAYYYHLYNGWYDESPWRIENPYEAYVQLANIDVSGLEKEESEILQVILQMLREAIDNRYPIYISYD